MAENSSAVPDDFGNCRGSFAALCRPPSPSPASRHQSKFPSKRDQVFEKQRCIPAFEDDAKQRMW